MYKSIADIRTEPDKEQVIARKWVGEGTHYIDLTDVDYACIYHYEFPETSPPEQTTG